MTNQRVAPPEPARPWTKAEDYLGSLARKRSIRRAHEPKLRTQPEAPRMLLSTAPFLALIGALAILAVAIMIAAFPGTQPHPQSQAAQHELGKAERGWFQEAQREFRKP